MSDTFATYWQVLVKRLPLLLLLSFIAAVVAYSIASFTKPAYQVHFSYLVSLSAREATPEFRFDGYYALQATDLFSATLAKWMQTPEVISQAYHEAGLPLAATDPRSIRRVVTAEKTAPQLVEVVVQESSAATAQRLSEGLRAVMERSIANYHEHGIPALTFRAVPTEPWVGTPAVAKNVIAVATFIFALFLGINVVLFVESLRNTTEK